MYNITFEDSDTYSIAILIKEDALKKDELLTYFIKPLQDLGVDKEFIACISLQYNDKGKAPVKLIKEYLVSLLDVLEGMGCQHIYCADAAYFKVLTKQQQAEKHLGYVLPCAIEGYEHFNVLLGVNHRSIMYNPNNKNKLDLSVQALADTFNNNPMQLGGTILRDVYYPDILHDIEAALESLHQYPSISCDIEAFSLRHTEAGIGTIAFSWNATDGFAFPVDYMPLSEPIDGCYGTQNKSLVKKTVLKKFFKSYKGNIKYHKANYDIKVLIYELFMDNLLDTKGLLEGLEVMCRDFDDTRLVAYLALNSTARPELGLKQLAHEYAGNYAQEDIKNIKKIPLDQLLEYNLVDTCCTNYVYNKHYPTVLNDNQENIYKTLFLPSQKTIIQTELTGMPISMPKVLEAEQTLKDITSKHLKEILNAQIVKDATGVTKLLKYNKDYADRVSKAKNPDKIKEKDFDTFPVESFNPGSGTQLQTLLFACMELPIIGRTDGGQPSTDGKTLKSLLNHTDNEEYLKVINAIRLWGKAEKILSTFIPAFKQAVKGPDGIHYLFGSFNLGGAVSGRMSSSDPNLQQIPSGSDYGKLIKQCFISTDEWLFVGADFKSLEDYISALRTKDPNKLKIYLDGYDSHSFRAYAYFPQELGHLENTVEGINSIEQLFPKVRQRSKAPTFALTFDGTYVTLMNNCGFTKKEALAIQRSYHELYKISDQWTQTQLDIAAQVGYADVAFGLRVRTPMLAKTIRNSRSTPYMAIAEGRTVGNALIQSYGLLNNRAANEFMQRVWDSPYKCDIKPSAMIHDSIYLMVRNDIEIIEWVNKNLIECMQWQELEEIKHDKVKLGAELDVHYINWSQPITITNNATQQEIIDIVNNKSTEYNEK